jgi:hypothetical protein
MKNQTIADKKCDNRHRGKTTEGEGTYIVGVAECGCQAVSDRVFLVKTIFFFLNSVWMWLVWCVWAAIVAVTYAQTITQAPPKPQIIPPLFVWNRMPAHEQVRCGVGWLSFVSCVVWDG